MKHGWQKTIFDKVCTIYTGNSINENIKNIKYRNLSKGYNYISTKDIGLNYNINYENGVKIPFSENCFKIAPANTPLLCIEGGSAGKKIGITNQAVCFVNKLCAFVNDKKIVESKFLFYYLQTQFFKQNFYNNKTGLIGGVSVGKMKKLPVKFPVNISEQKRIVKILDKAFEDIEKIKENAKQNLQNSKDLFQNYLNKIFTENTKSWQKTTLGEITDIIAGQSPESKYYNKEQKGLPFYQGKKEFTEKFIGPPFIWTTVITKESFKNDILLSVRAPVGPINYATEKCCIGRGLAAIRVKNNITREFIFYYLLSIQKNISGHDGVVFPSINRDEICSLKLKIPIHLAEQKQIVKKLDILQEKTKKLEEIYNKKLQLAEELKQSILHKAFNGDL